MIWIMDNKKWVYQFITSI